MEVEELSAWADEQFRLNPQEDARFSIAYDGEGKQIRGEIEPPDSLKQLGQLYTVVMYIDEGGKQIMDIVWGGGLYGHWGLRIGSSNLDQYNRDESRHQIEWQPGVWVLGIDAD